MSGRDAPELSPDGRTEPAAPLAGAPWLTAPATQAVLAALARGGHEARIVGGAVRNALIGTAVTDIDIATTATPEETMRLARAAGLAAFPTGIAHGTVTVVAAHHPFEVTTLRRDEETFGRHARVAFTTDWAEDARRRDFTINALYADAAGRIHDPLGGAVDLAARRVRFIGDPHARIREDYLRIFRFFRFTAEYASGVPDAAGLAACAEMQAGLAGLSGERLRSEMMKLLAAPAAMGALGAMAATGILARIVDTGAASGPGLGSVPDLDALARLVAIEAALGLAPDPALRLALMAAPTADTAEALRARLRLSNEEARTMHDLLAAAPLGTDPGIAPRFPDTAARAAVYRLGQPVARRLALALWARSGAPADDPSWTARLGLVGAFAPPALPLKGSDIVARGIPPGPAVGRILADLESWWIGTDFAAGEARCVEKLDALVAAERGPPLC